MKISTKGRYGLRAMIDIAQDVSNKPVSIKDIAKRQDVSDIYLEQVFSVLKKAKLVKSIKGAGGGYLLAAHPKEISVGEVLRELEGDLSIIEMDSEVKCEIQAFLYENLWQEINKRIHRLMNETTLQELIDDYESNKNEARTMYYI